MNKVKCAGVTLASAVLSIFVGPQALASHSIDVKSIIRIDVASTSIGRPDELPSMVFGIDPLGSVIVDGDVMNISEFALPATYQVVRSGVLNLGSRAIADRVWVNLATLNMDNAEVREGLEVFDGIANIQESTIRNENGTGLTASMFLANLNHASKVRLVNSEVSGSTTGLLAGPMSEVLVENSVITNLSGTEKPEGIEALRIASGSVKLDKGSVVKGALLGIKIIDVPESILDIASQTNSLVVDSSLIDGGLGASILVDTDEIVTAITIKNGSQLVSGDGRLLDVRGTGTSILTLDDVDLTGDVVASIDSQVNLLLKNNATLVGSLSNVKSAEISSGASWGIGQSSKLDLLLLDGGKVRFVEDGFHSLAVNELNGNGTFDMRINLHAAQGDLLEVNGEASGHHILSIQNTGIEEVPSEFDPLLIVHTEGGDAQFGLLGGRVDLGAYSYQLEKYGTDWFIMDDGKIISPSTRAALALFNAAPNIWNSELTTLRSRMGEVRGQEEGGGWIRSYGNRFDASMGSGLSYQQNQQGMSFGADAPMPIGKGSLVVGLMGGYSKSDLDLSRGSSGTVNSYYIGTYGTWLSDDGYYLDGVLKFNRFRNESKVAMSDGSKAKGRYSNTGVGGSVEFGKHIKLTNGYFIEPYTQLSGVSIGGDSYSLDNGMMAKNSRTQSVLGKVGTTAGRNFALEDGSVVQPYVRVAMAHEFARSNDVTVNNTRFNNDLFGSRAELGAGVAVTLSKRIQLHADFDYMKGKHVEQPWGANLGLKLAF